MALSEEELKLQRDIYKDEGSKKRSDTTADKNNVKRNRSWIANFGAVTIAQYAGVAGFIGFVAEGVLSGTANMLGLVVCLILICFPAILDWVILWMFNERTGIPGYKN